jgi:hypothetical protein
MDPTRSMKIADLEVRIALLKQQEQKLRSMSSSTLTAPERRDQRKNELASTLKKLDETAGELTRVHQEKP